MSYMKAQWKWLTSVIASISEISKKNAKKQQNTIYNWQEIMTLADLYANLSLNRISFVKNYF